MYKIFIKNLNDASETLIYQSNSKNTNLVIEPKLQFEWQQPGSLSFSMLPGHPAYDDIHAMVTFVTAYWDDEELFYGRVVTVDKSLFGQKEIYCEGALGFLSDGELQAYDGTTTVQTFFSKCITDYNATVEARKQFSVGTCEFTDSGVYFKMEENSEPKSTLDEQLTKRFGGCFVVRKTTNGHSISYLRQVGSTSTQKIRICENVKDRTDHDSGESLFSVLRPIGGTDDTTNEPIVLSGTGVIEIPSMIAKYGRIVKTETFSDQTTEEGLRAEANKYIARLGMSTDKLPVTIDFGFVDFHYLNPSIGRIHFGDVFTDIEGYENESLTVGALELDLENPANDSLSLYNQTYLDAREYSAMLESATGRNSSGRSGSRGSSLAKTLASAQEAEENKFWKHATATDDALMLYGKRIQLAADLLIGSTREYDILASDVEELYGTHLHGNGNGFWEMYGKIHKDAAGNISITDGAGLRVERTEGGVTTSYGVYDDQTLTAGVMIDKLNSDNTTYVLGDKIIIGNAAISYQIALVTGSDASNYSAINPHQLRYYELINGQYVHSDDTVAKPNKTYYVQKVGLPSDNSAAALTPNGVVVSINNAESSYVINARKINIDSTSGSSFHIDENGRMSFNAENAIAAINAATAEINANKIKIASSGGSDITLSSKLSLSSDGYIELNGSTSVWGNLRILGSTSKISAPGLIIGSGGSSQGEETGSFSYRGESFNIQRAFLGYPNTYITLGRILTTSATDLDFNHSHAVSMEEVTSGSNAGKVHAVIGIPVAYNSQSTANRESFFDIAASQTYLDGVAAEWALAQSKVVIPSSIGGATIKESASVSVPSTTMGERTDYTIGFTLSSPTATGNNNAVLRWGTGSDYTQNPIVLRIRLNSYRDSVLALGMDAAANALELVDSGYSDISGQSIYLDYDDIYEVVARVPDGSGNYSELYTTLIAPSSDAPTGWINLTGDQIEDYGFSYSNGVRVSNSRTDNGTGSITVGTNYVWLQGSDGDWGVARDFSVSAPAISVGGWQITSDPSTGGTKVFVTVNGTSYSHVFDNYP